MRIFADIKVRNGPDAAGLYSIQRVPIMYGDPSWVVAQIIKGGSENTLLPTPMFSAWIENIKLDPKRRQDSQFVGKVSTVERQFDTLSQTYGSDPGVRQDVERYMPVPYELNLRLDVWTSNITTKLQLFEQIGIIFNPSIQLQQNSNLMDWTSIFEVWLEDYTFTSRSIPQGGNEDRDVMSFKFKVPVWINPPAKLKRSGLIAEIVANIFEGTATLDGEEFDPFRTFIDTVPIQIITTAGNYKIQVSKSTGSDIITLLNEYGAVEPALNWESLIQKYGQINPEITKIRLKLDPDIESSANDIIGNIALDSLHKNQLLFTPDLDTLPGNTLPPIATIIDPTEVSPGQGLPVASPGQRYLITSHESHGEEPAIPFGVTISPWGTTIIAYPNDIIEYNGSVWSVVFDSRNAVGKNYVINNENASQYMFDADNGEWTYTYYGTYQPGYWRIDNIIQAPDGTTISIHE